MVVYRRLYAGNCIKTANVKTTEVSINWVELMTSVMQHIVVTSIPLQSETLPWRHHYDKTLRVRRLTSTTPTLREARWKGNESPA